MLKYCININVHNFFQQALEAQMIADGDQAFQEFDKNINDAIKQNEAVEEEIRKDIVEQSEHRIEES